MKILLVFLLLAGCDEYTVNSRCIDGVLYHQYHRGDPWLLADGAPSHAG